MKKLFLGSVALVALGLGAPAALAAEMRVPAYTPPPPPAPIYANWSGCYAGGVAGYQLGPQQSHSRGHRRRTSGRRPTHNERLRSERIHRRVRRATCRSAHGSSASREIGLPTTRQDRRLI